ncbi:glycosyltransferase [Lachnospiraceae bacterium]|nr:glycosyltransferase [Lachnospiraceae bacterium]
MYKSMDKKGVVVSMVKVSVILPVYNEEKYLPQCLDSICGQTLREIEIICVDDGSTDSSPQILEGYAKKDARVKLIRQENQFAGAARNKGMSYATGKYLSFLDADDYYAPEMLEKMAEEAEKNKADIVICRYGQCCAEGGMEEEQPNAWDYEDLFLNGKGIFSGGELLCAGIFQIAKGWAWDKLFRTEFVVKCGYQFPCFRSSEDGFFVYMLMARAERMAYRKEKWAVHRISSGSLSNTKEKDWKNGFTMWSLIAEELKRQGLYGIYGQSLINEFLYFMLWYLESMKTFEAFSNCYQYIQSAVEPEFGILDYGKDFFFQKEIYDWYQEVMELPLAEYLFYHRGT